MEALDIVEPRRETFRWLRNLAARSAINWETHVCTFRAHVSRRSAAGSRLRKMSFVRAIEIFQRPSARLGNWNPWNCKQVEGNAPAAPRAPRAATSRRSSSGAENIAVICSQEAVILVICII